MPGRDDEAAWHDAAVIELHLGALVAPPAIAIIAVAVLTTGIAFGGTKLPVYLVGLAALVTTVVLAALYDFPNGREEAVRVRAAPGRIEIEKRGNVRTVVVRSARLQPRSAGAPVVRLSVRDGGLRSKLDLVVPDEARGRALLRALGQDAEHAIAVFRLGGGVHASRVTVGADGVLIERGGRPRFLAFAEIESIDSSKSRETVSLRLTGGATLRLGARVGRRSRSQAAAEVRALRARLEDAFAAHLASTASRPPEADEATTLLARGRRSARAWLTALQHLREGEAYRAAAIPAEHLWRVVEDPSAEPSARAGAAVALARDLDAEGRARVKRAARAAASPRVRVALDAASTEADGDGIVRAFEEVESEEELAAKAASTRRRASRKLEE